MWPWISQDTERFHHRKGSLAVPFDSHTCHLPCPVPSPGNHSAVLHFCNFAILRMFYKYIFKIKHLFGMKHFGIALSELHFFTQHKLLCVSVVCPSFDFKKFFLNCGKIQIIENLPFLSIEFGGIKYIHITVLPSPSIHRTLFILQNWNCLH